MSEELKPCPFCDGPAEFRDANTYPNGERSPAFVRCTNHCVIRSGYDGDEVIRRWNTRPSEEQLRQWALSASELAARMHAAAVGAVMGPMRGVVEDVADVREKLLACQEENGRLRSELADITEVARMLYSMVDGHCAWHVYYCQSTHGTGLPCDCDGDQVKRRANGVLGLKEGE